MKPQDIRGLNQRVREQIQTQQQIDQEKDQTIADIVDQIDLLSSHQDSVASNLETILQTVGERSYEDKGDSTFTANTITQSLVPHEKPPQNLKGLYMRRTRRHIRRSVLGWQEHDSVLIPLGKIDDEGDDDTSHGYIEVVVQKNVEVQTTNGKRPKKSGKNLHRVETDTSRIGIRVFSGKPDLDGSGDRKALCDNKDLVLVGEVFSDMFEGLPSPVGTPARKTLAKFTPAPLKMPDLDNVTIPKVTGFSDEEKADFISQGFSLEEIEKLEKQQKARQEQQRVDPKSKQVLARMVLAEIMSKPDAYHRTFVWNSAEYIAEQRAILEQIESMTDMAGTYATIKFMTMFSKP